MAGLLYKEFLVNKKIAIGVLAFIMFLSFSSLTKPAGTPFNTIELHYMLTTMTYIFAYLLMGEALQNGIFAADERKKWAGFIISSPATEKQQVLCKYYFSLICAVALFAWFYLIEQLSIAINDYKPEDVSIMFMILLYVFSCTIFLRAVEFPFYVRFGKKFGNQYRMFIFIGVGFIVLIYLLFGDMSFITKEGFVEFGEYILLGDKDTQAPPIVVGMKRFMNLFPAISLAAYYLSYRISVKLYKKGAERFE